MIAENSPSDILFTETQADGQSIDRVFGLRRTGNSATAGYDEIATSLPYKGDRGGVPIGGIHGDIPIGGIHGDVPIGG